MDMYWRRVTTWPRTYVNHCFNTINSKYRPYKDIHVLESTESIIKFICIYMTCGSDFEIVYF